MLNEFLQINSNNAKIICDYIIVEQNELNIKESTKETKIKRKIRLPAIMILLIVLCL
jgi:hypothetical protein